MVWTLTPKTASCLTKKKNPLWAVLLWAHSSDKMAKHNPMRSDWVIDATVDEESSVANTLHNDL